MTINTIISSYKAKDEAYFTTTFGCSKDAGLKAMTAIAFEYANDRKAKRIARNKNLTPEQLANRKAKRDARRQALKEAMKALKAAKALESANLVKNAKKPKAA